MIPETQPTHEEFEYLLSVMLSFFDKHGVEGRLLRRVSSFTWATCGVASYFYTESTEGVASLLVTRKYCHLVPDNIESPCFEQETLLTELGWKFRVSNWTSPLAELNNFTTGTNLIADFLFGGAKEVSADLVRLQASLTSTEGERFRLLGQLCTQAVDSTGMSVRPEMTLFEIIALLGNETYKRGVQPIVNLISTDERIHRIRHSLPTGIKLEK